MHMLHHISLGAADIDRSAEFYDKALAPLGYVRVWSDIRVGEQGQAVGYGAPGEGDKLAIKQVSPGTSSSHPGFHVAFSAPTRESVVRFHAAATSAGGTNNGGPGIREHYGPNCFAAFVVDPDGHHIEAVCKSAA